MGSRVTFASLAPEGWCCYISGQYFKIGTHNRVMVWRHDEWVLTRGTSLKSIYKAIEAKEGDITDPAKRRDYAKH